MMRSASTGTQLKADESCLKGPRDVSATRRPQDQPFLLGTIERAGCAEVYA